MFKRISQQYRWHNMRKEIKNYIRNCDSCQTNKTQRKSFKAPMEISSTSHQPFERVALDVVGPLPLCENGHKFILTMQDDLTKFSYAIPIPNHEAKTIAKGLISFMTMFGIPKSILTDNGTDFSSNIIKEVTKLLRIKHIFTTIYHPQSNGALERSRSPLKDYLKHFVNDKQTDWDEYIPLAMFAYNTNVHSSTRFTPYELVFGYKPIIPSSVSQNPELKYTYDSYIDQLKYKLNKTHQIARENLIASKEKSKLYYDKNSNCPDYKVGDEVYLMSHENKPGTSKKLNPLYKGPFKIIKIHKNRNVTILLKNNKHLRVHVNQLKPKSSISA